MFVMHGALMILDTAHSQREKKDINNGEYTNTWKRILYVDNINLCMFVWVLCNNNAAAATIDPGVPSIIIGFCSVYPPREFISIYISMVNLCFFFIFGRIIVLTIYLFFRKSFFICILWISYSGQVLWISKYLFVNMRILILYIGIFLCHIPDIQIFVYECCQLRYFLNCAVKIVDIVLTVKIEKIRFGWAWILKNLDSMYFLPQNAK